jgi:hypothetical protein
VRMGTCQATLLRTWVLGRRWVILIWKGDDPRVDGLEGENEKREVFPGLPWIASGEHRLPFSRHLVPDVNFIGSDMLTFAVREIELVTYQATYTLAGPLELRWGNLKGMSA